MCLLLLVVLRVRSVRHLQLYLRTGLSRFICHVHLRFGIQYSVLTLLTYRKEVVSIYPDVQVAAVDTQACVHFRLLRLLPVLNIHIYTSDQRQLEVQKTA